MRDPRVAAVIRLIDEANARDPETIDVAGVPRPAALAYGERMTGALQRIAPDASAHLQIATRGQHVERWTVPRATYEAGRTGYLKWRKDLQAFHATRLAELMAASGYDGADAGRVAELVKKVGLKTDPEAQRLEDVACLVFLEHYAEHLFQRYDDAKVIDILRKTARKMSPEGIAAAARLDIGARQSRLLAEALAG